VKSLEVNFKYKLLKVRTGGGYILLDKFIEVNAPIEEAYKTRLDNVSGKYKHNVGKIMNK